MASDVQTWLRTSYIVEPTIIYIDNADIITVECHMSLEISIKKMRGAMDEIKDLRDSTMLKLAYLGAYRNSEICTQVSPSELLRNSSKPYGCLMKIDLKDYIVKQATIDEPAEIVKALILTTAVAKRGKKIMKNKDQEKEQDDKETLQSYTDEELVEAFKRFDQLELLDEIYSGEIKVEPQLIKILLGKLHFKIVALPCSLDYEPWTLDLIQYMSKVRKAKDLSFPITRKHFHTILRKSLKDILPKKGAAKGSHNPKNILRHYRLSHLTEYYGFEPMDLSLFSGWSMTTAYSQVGVRASPNMDAYLHLKWHSYFPKLLTPIKQFY